MIKLLVLGCGNVGSVIVRDLLRSRCEVVVGDANERSLDLARREHGDKVMTSRVDVTDHVSLSRLMKGVDAIINSTSYAYNLYVLRAAISAGRDLVDLGGLYHMTLKELKYDRRAKGRGISAVIGMGDDPGTSNIMAKLGSEELDSVDEVKIRWGSSSPSAKSAAFGFSVATCLDEASMDAVIFRDGRYQEIPPLAEKETTKFPRPLGSMETYAILHSELATLPKYFRGVRNVSYKDSWDSDTLGVVRFLKDSGLASQDRTEVDGSMVSPRKLLLKLLAPSEPEGTVGCLKVQLTGRKDGTRASKSYFLGPVTGSKRHRATVTPYTTAMPASIVGQMLAKGGLQEKGVIPPETFAEEEVALFLKEMERRELRVRQAE